MQLPMQDLTSNVVSVECGKTQDCLTKRRRIAIRNVDNVMRNPNHVSG